jgi:hypothetical protein
MRSTASTPNPAQLIGAFGRVALGTALVMATDLFLPNVTQIGPRQNAVRLAVLAVVLYGAWLALTRAQFSGPRETLRCYQRSRMSRAAPPDPTS